MDTLQPVALGMARSNRVVAAALIACTWAVVVLLTIPRAISRGVADYGFLTGIAERLRVGDVLYTQVWDNKDPLVYFSLTLARSLGPNGVFGAWILELLWVVLAAAAVYVIARFQGLSRTMSSYVGFGLTPLMMLGAAYYMGSTHPPAIALLLVVIALLFSRHPLTAGVVVGLLLFFKLVMVPLAVVAVAATIIALKRRSDIKWLLIGFGAAAFIMAVVLGVRGELVGFITTQPENVLHSQTPIVSADQTGLLERIKRNLVILVNPQIAAIQFTTAGHSRNDRKVVSSRPSLRGVIGTGLGARSPLLRKGSTNSFMGCRRSGCLSHLPASWTTAATGVRVSCDGSIDTMDSGDNRGHHDAHP